MSIRQPLDIEIDDQSLSLNDKEMVREIVHNEYYYRRAIMEKLEHSSRDLYKECGYSETQDITPVMLYDLYIRFPIAARVVDLPVDEAWRLQPDVYETEDEDEVTVFEAAWDQLDEQLEDKDRNWFVDEKGSTVWEMLQRADRMSRIGQYGVLFLEFDDVGTVDKDGKEKTWQDPAPGFEDDEDESGGEFVSNIIEEEDEEKVNGKGSIEQELADINDEADSVDEEGDIEADADGLESDTKREKQVPNVPEPKVRLVGLRAFDQTHAEVTSWYDDPSSPMFGKPKEYTITLENQETTNQSTLSIGSAFARDVKVHWSRIIHLADGLLCSEYIGTPAMLPVANELQDIRKVYGASGEGYWRNAFPGLSFETHPILGAKAKINQEALATEIERYKNTLDRYMATVGGSWKTLNNQVTEPTPHVEARIESICIYLGCPVRIFKGSERGELASSQDKDSWDERMTMRQNNYLTPRVIVPFVNRLIAVGTLPEPKDGFRIEWPDLSALGALSKADLATKLTTAITQYISGGADAIMSPNDFLTRVLGYTQEEADKIADAALDHINEANPEADDVGVIGQQPKQPNPFEQGMMPGMEGEMPPGGMPPEMMGAEDEEEQQGPPFKKKKGPVPPQLQKFQR